MIYGMYAVEAISNTHSECLPDGTASKIMFTPSLKRVDESLTSMFGDLNKQASGLISGVSNLPGQITSAIDSVRSAAGSLVSKAGGAIRMTGISGLPVQMGARLTPDFMLKLDSKDITTNIKDLLISLTLTDNRGFEADQLDIESDDTDGNL